MEFIKKGSFTVEAAFIMSVVLVVVFGILKYGLVLHDEAVLEAAVLRVLEKGEMAAKHLGDMESGRPDYEKILLEKEPSEQEKLQEKLLQEELFTLFLWKRPLRLKIYITGALGEKREIKLWGNAGKRSLLLFYPTEYRRRIGK